MKHQFTFVLFITVHSAITSAEIAAFTSQFEVITALSRCHTSIDASIKNANLDEKLLAGRADRAPFFVARDEKQSEMSEEDAGTHEFNFNFDEAKNSLVFQMVYQIMVRFIVYIEMEPYATCFFSC